jgi:hypothetical protein
MMTTYCRAFELARKFEPNLRFHGKESFVTCVDIDALARERKMEEQRTSFSPTRISAELARTSLMTEL